MGKLFSKPSAKKQPSLQHLQAQSEEPKVPTSVVKQYVHTGSVGTISASANHIVSGSQDKVIVIYDPHSKGVERRLEGHSKAITQVVCKDGRVVSASKDKTVRVWNESSTTPSVTLEGHIVAVAGVAVNNDFTSIASGARDGHMYLWDVTRATKTQELHVSRNVVTAMHWLPQCPLFVQSGEDKSLKIWDSRTLSVAACFPTQQYIHTDCCVSDDGNYIATSSNGFSKGNGCFATLWDIRTSKHVYYFEGHSQSVTSCCFVPGETLKLSTVSRDKSWRIWDATSGKGMATIEGSAGYESVVAFNPNQLAAGCTSGAISLASWTDETFSVVDSY